ncbi:MAG TPA: hypothetical protein VG943_16535 [Caulobacterales bacterium]|nr:hypothetical protein [Caulobacterales bacterium]
MQRFAQCLVGVAALSLAGCDRASAPAANTTSTASDISAVTTTATAAASPAVWFICDAIDAPSVFVLRKDASGQHASIMEYDKQRSAEVATTEFELGQPEGAAGSVYTPLMHDGQQTGFVRAINPGMLETPSAAYTQPFTSIGIGDRRIACRWLARSRLIGFTARRSFAITEDADGDLIYTTFNFDDATTHSAIDLSDAQRSTRFSLEVRGGEETTTPQGSEFRFSNHGYSYVVSAPREGEASLRVLRSGSTVQNEPILATEAGSGA